MVWRVGVGRGEAGQGSAGQGRAGQGRAGHGRAGQGRAGQGTFMWNSQCVIIHRLPYTFHVMILNGILLQHIH